MKNIIKYPTQNTWETLLQRPLLEKKDLRNTVQEIFLKVKNERDSAVSPLTSIETLTVSDFSYFKNNRKYVSFAIYAGKKKIE